MYKTTLSPNINSSLKKPSLNSSPKSKKKKNIKKISQKEQDVNLFINYLLSMIDSKFNKKKFTYTNIKVNNILADIKNYKSEYYKHINDNNNIRIYRCLPHIDFLIYAYNKYFINYKTNTLDLVYDIIYKYICVISVYENLIYNAIYSPLSNNFIIYSKYVKNGLMNLENSNLYLKYHNILFSKMYNTTINLNELKKFITVIQYDVLEYLNDNINNKIKLSNINLNNNSILDKFNYKTEKDIYEYLGVDIKYDLNDEYKQKYLSLIKIKDLIVTKKYNKQIDEFYLHVNDIKNITF